MSKDQAKSLSELIGASGSGLGRLAAEARKRADLTDYLRSRLPDPLADGLVHCDIRPDDTLVVAAVNPECAARLRYEEHQLREYCREFGVATTAVKVRVAN